MERREFLKNASVAGAGLVGSALIGNSIEAKTPKLNPNDFAELKPLGPFKPGSIHSCRLEDMVKVIIEAKISYDTYKLLEPLIVDDDCDYEDKIYNENNKTTIKIDNTFTPIITSKITLRNNAGQITIENNNSMYPTKMNHFIDEINKFSIRKSASNCKNIQIIGSMQYPACMSLSIVILQNEISDILENFEQNKNIQLFLPSIAFNLKPLVLGFDSVHADIRKDEPFDVDKYSNNPKEIIEILDKMESLDPTYKNYKWYKKRAERFGRFCYTKTELIEQIQKTRKQLQSLIKDTEGSA